MFLLFWARGTVGATVKHCWLSYYDGIRHYLERMLMAVNVAMLAKTPIYFISNKGVSVASFFPEVSGELSQDAKPVYCSSRE